MKFADLINRLEAYLKEKPERLHHDLLLIVDDLHTKFAEYKRIKKAVFKRQVEKAYQVLANKDEFVKAMESKIDEEDASNSDSSVSSTIDEQALAVAIRGDPTPSNEINNMITSIYMANQPKRKSNLKTATTSGDPSVESPSAKTAQDSSENSAPKRVKFSNDAQQLNIGAKNETISKQNEKLLNQLIEKQQQLSQQQKPAASTNSINNKKLLSSSSSSQSSSKTELIRSPINFDMFACDQELKEMIFRRIYYILSPEHFLSNGKTPPRGFLLHGPPGCGKTQLVYALAGELDLPLLKVTSTELISGVSGESEENIRAMFDKAVRSAPCILFIDEIEAISQRRETATKNMEHRIVTQLLSCFDDLAVRPYVPLVVIGATNQADSLDIGLRRAGRFDQEIAVGIPDDKQRSRILALLCSKIRLNSDIDMPRIVMNTPGYVGSDLNALISEALISALDRRLNDQLAIDNNNTNTANQDAPANDSDKQFVLSLIEWIKKKLNAQKSLLTTAPTPKDVPGSELINEKNGESLTAIEIGQSDFETAIGRVQPSSKREGFATVPDVSWEDIGALQHVRDELKTAILAPVKYARQCEIFNFTKPPGILMVGPPGCGKTLLAKAIAKESGVNFISVKGPELLNMYVGESERAVRSLFQRARTSKPCVIFFDEIDAICVRRSDGTSDSGATTRVVNQMLTEMDGLESRKGVFLMAASNRPDIVDPAILRPGRLDKIIYVGLPNAPDRFEILKTITKCGTRPKIDADVDFQVIANDQRCQTFTGADLSALVREASEFALKEFIKEPIAENEIVKGKHFELAFKKIKPSVSLKDCDKYEKMRSMCVNLDN